MTEEIKNYYKELLKNIKISVLRGDENITEQEARNLSEIATSFYKSYGREYLNKLVNVLILESVQTVDDKDRDFKSGMVFGVLQVIDWLETECGVALNRGVTSNDDDGWKVE